MMSLRCSTSPFASKSARRSPSASTRVVDGSRARSKRFSSNAASGSTGAIWSTTSSSAAGLDHARQLGDQQLGATRVVQRAQRRGEVEREVVERQLLAVADDDLDVRRSVRSRPLGHRRVDLERDDLAHARRERVGERAGSGADVERALLAA